jgi:hypothetical protein
VQFRRRANAHNLAKMSVDQVIAAAVLVVQISGERRSVHAANNASFFVGLARGSGGKARIAVDTTFGKGPAPGLGAHQKKLDPTVTADPIAYRGDNDSLGRGAW